MKRINGVKLSLTLLFTFVLYGGSTTANGYNRKFDIHTYLKHIEEDKDDMEDFLDAIGFQESSNRYHVVNRYGYMGRYQFGRRTLKGLGYKVSRKEFLSNPDLQERAMYDLLKHNKEKLQPYIDEFEGKVIHGVKITESGILAAAHLGGQTNVRKFFDRGKIFRDGNGTPITKYIEVFGDYNLPTLK